MKRYITTIILAVVAVLLTATVVWAASANYVIDITLKETGGTTRTSLPVLVTANNTGWATGGFMLASALDTDLRLGTVQQSYMPADDKVAIFVLSLPANSTQTYKYYLGYDPPKTAFPIIFGYNGYIYIPEDPSLEIGNNFKIVVYGYWDMSFSGPARPVLEKPNSLGAGPAFSIHVGAANTLHIMIDNDAVSLGIGSMTSTIHEVMIIADATNFFCYLDGVLKQTLPLGGASVPVTADNWFFASDNGTTPSNTSPMTTRITIWK